MPKNTIFFKVHVKKSLWRIMDKEIFVQQLLGWLMKEFILPMEKSMFAIAAQQDVKIAMELFQALIAYYLLWKQITLVCRLLVHKELHLYFVERTEFLRDPEFLAECTNVLGPGGCPSGRE